MIAVRLPATILVTGSSTGIGRASALHFAEKGARVFAGVRTLSDAPEHERITPVVLDVTDADQTAVAAETIAAEVGDDGLAGLFNNAGIVVAGPLEHLALDELRHQLEVNVIGQIGVTQAMLPLLRMYGPGRILFTGSVSGKLKLPFIGPYVASKHAVHGIAGALRRELRPDGLGVSTLVCGTIATPIWDKGVAGSDESLDALPAEGRARYGSRLAALKTFAEKAPSKGIPPEAVAAAAWKALTDKTPKAEYAVGLEAKAVSAVVQHLPTSLFDLAIDKQFN